MKVTMCMVCTFVLLNEIGITPVSSAVLCQNAIPLHCKK